MLLTSLGAWPVAQQLSPCSPAPPTDLVFRATLRHLAVARVHLARHPRNWQSLTLHEQDTQVKSALFLSLVLLPLLPLAQSLPLSLSLLCAGFSLSLIDRPVEQSGPMEKSRARAASIQLRAAQFAARVTCLFTRSSASKKSTDTQGERSLSWPGGRSFACNALVRGLAEKEQHWLAGSERASQRR